MDVSPVPIQKYVPDNTGSQQQLYRRDGTCTELNRKIVDLTTKWSYSFKNKLPRRQD